MPGCRRAADLAAASSSSGSALRVLPGVTSLSWRPQAEGAVTPVFHPRQPGSAAGVLHGHGAGVQSQGPRELGQPGRSQDTCPQSDRPSTRRGACLPTLAISLCPGLNPSRRAPWLSVTPRPGFDSQAGTCPGCGLRPQCGAGRGQPIDDSLSSRTFLPLPLWNQKYIFFKKGWKWLV